MSAILVGGNPSVVKPIDVHQYGVEWNYGSTSTALTRLGDAAAFSDPSPAVGTGSGSSPFDSLYPWSEMTEFNIISNAVSHQKGASGFSRTSYDTAVRIPKFWYKVEQDTSNSKMRFYIADGALPGYAVHPAFLRGDGSERDYIYVGKYNTGSGYVTKSGLAPLVNITRATARSNSASKGANWWQYDYAAWCAVWMLYLVEYADWNSQAQIGRGNVDSSNIQTNGGTDSMTYHTGRASGSDGSAQVQYRHIENPWGNVWEWIDGINFNSRASYICTTPANYADDTTTNYTAAGITLSTDGWITKLGVSSGFPWAFLPTAVGGSETTYLADYLHSYTGWRVLMVGGVYGSGSYAGLFYFNAVNASSDAYGSIGARLLFVP